MQMHGGQDQKASTVLYMERRSYLIIKYSSLSSLRRCSYCSYPVLNFWSGLPLSKSAMKLKSDSCRRCGYEHITWVVTTCSILRRRYLQGTFLGAKDASAKGIFQGNGEWLRELCPLHVFTGFPWDWGRLFAETSSWAQLLALYLVWGASSFLFISCLISYESSPCAVQHLPVAGRKDRSQPLNL